MQNFEFKGSYGVYKLRPQRGNFKMENNRQPCPGMEESMHYCLNFKIENTKTRKKFMKKFVSNDLIYFYHRLLNTWTF